MNEEDTCRKCGGIKFWQTYKGKLRAFCPCEVMEALNES